MATWLAADELDFHGAATVAGGWLQRARRLLEPLAAGPDHGWLAFHEGYIAHASGDGARAVELALAAAEIGRRFAVPDLEMLGLGLEGAALVSAAKVEDGMRCLDEATAAALAGEATIPISSAWTCCFLVSACTAVQDFERASEWCDRIAEFAARYGSRYMLGFCRAEYGAVHVWRGRWSEAEELLEGAVEAFIALAARVRSRPSRAVGRAPPAAGEDGRGDRPARRCGRVTRCSTLPRADRAGRGRSAPTATELIERLQRQSRDLTRRRCSSCSCAPRSPPADLDYAAGALTELRALVQLVGTGPLLASADLAEGMLAAARGDHERCPHAARGRGGRVRAERRAVRDGPGPRRARRDAGGTRPHRSRRCRVRRSRAGAPGAGRRIGGSATRR